MRRNALVTLALAPLLLAASPSRAFVLSEDALEGSSDELGAVLRGLSFTFTGPVLRPPLLPGNADPSGTGVFDLRPLLTLRHPGWKLDVHDQLASTVTSQSLPGLLAFGRGLPPARWLPLQWTIADRNGVTLRDSLDWAYFAVYRGRLSITVGRQPITFGRGLIWKPSDLISTFALTEVDTEFKPGVDAVRIDVDGQQSNLTVVAAAGRWNNALALRGSSFVARGKRSWGHGEAGVLAGFVRRDFVLGVDATFDLADHEVYSETTLTFPTAGSLSPRPPETSRAVLRSVAGATLRPRPHWTVTPELYWNGFGDWTPSNYAAIAQSDRVRVGEMYNLGKLYAATTAAWQAHPLVNLSAAALVNLRDPSSLLALMLRYNIAANVNLQAGAYWPVGRLASTATTARSEFGLYPDFFFVELKAFM